MPEGRSSTGNGDSTRTAAYGAGLRSLLFGDEASRRCATRSRKRSSEHEDEPAPDAGRSRRRSSARWSRNLLHFGERDAGDVGVPRADIIAVAEKTSFADLVALFAEAGHSRLPVYRGSLDRSSA